MNAAKHPDHDPILDLPIIEQSDKVNIIQDKWSSFEQWWMQSPHRWNYESGDPIEEVAKEAFDAARTWKS